MEKQRIEVLVIAKIFSLVVLGLLFLSPVLLYIYQFGIGLWPTHQDWVDMGSAISGIYSPIFAAATLVLLYKQYNLQRKSNELNSQARLSDNLLSHAISSLSEIKTKHSRESLLEYAHIVHDANKLDEGQPQSMLYGEHAELTLQLSQVFHNMYQLAKLQDQYSEALLSNLRGEIIAALPSHLLMQFDKNYLGRRIHSVKPFFYIDGF